MRKSIYSERSRALRELLIQARRDAGLTQEQLAVALERPQSFVSKYEAGERRLDVIEFIEVAEGIGSDPAGMISTISKSSADGGS